MHGVQQAQQREPSPPATIIFLQPENNHGTKIFEEGIRQGRTRDEGTQRRDVEERPLGTKGHKPQAGDRDRPFGGEGGGCESPEEDLEEAGYREIGTPIEDLDDILPAGLVPGAGWRVVDCGSFDLHGIDRVFERPLHLPEEAGFRKDRGAERR